MLLSNVLYVMEDYCSIIVETEACGIIFEGYKCNFTTFKLGAMYYDYKERTVECISQRIDRWGDNAICIKISS